MRYANLPPDITALPQWVCVWNGSKIPMKANERKGASSVNPETWCDFETAQKAVSDGIYDHIGFVFNNNGIVGIDIDCGFDDDGFCLKRALTSCELVGHTPKSREAAEAFTFCSKGIYP